MESGDRPSLPKYMTYSRSAVPVLGALIDYVDTSLQFLLEQSFTVALKMYAKETRSKLTGSFLAGVCLLLGFICNVKLEVVTFEKNPLANDLHFMLMSRDDKLYIDDIDVSKILWCVEASDVMVLLISCGLILYSSNVKAPLSEYLFLPWMGVCLRGLFLRQGPTVAALVYTMIIINGTVDPLFVTAFSFLFFVEARLWLEIARVVRSRWEARNNFVSQESKYEVETLWSNEDVQSIEVQNYVY